MTNVDDRIRWYRDILSEDPTSRIFVDLAEVLYQQGHWNDVIIVCRKGLELHPQLSRARVLLGLALWETGEREKAEQELQQVSSEFEENAVIYKALATISWETGRPGRACKFLDIYLHFHPHDDEARKRRRSWEEQLRYPPATPVADRGKAEVQEAFPATKERQEPEPAEPPAQSAAGLPSQPDEIQEKAEQDRRETIPQGEEPEPEASEPGEPSRHPQQKALSLAQQWLEKLTRQTPTLAPEPFFLKEEDRRQLYVILKGTA